MIDIDYIKKNNLLLLEVVSGSKVYGLETPESDTDIKGVFYLPKEMFYGSCYIDQVSNSTNDITYYELGRYIELLCKNNPNLLEMLCTPNSSVLYKHPLMDIITPDIFLSKLASETFAGYALTQVKKAKGLNKKFNNPLDRERLGVADFCFILSGHKTIQLHQWLRETGRNIRYCGLAKLHHTKGVYALFYNEFAGYEGISKSEKSNDVTCSSIEKGEPIVAYLFFNQESYSAHCKSYTEYWNWMQKRNESRYKGNQEHGKGYDAKNMMHTIRLLQLAKELFESGTLNVKRSNRDELLSIKKGERTYIELMSYAEELVAEIENAVAISTLQDKPDENKARKILITIREKLYDHVTTN